jgi:uncharacterized protein YndB with AHSA1/START domain
MATIRKELIVDAPLARVWDAIRDVGALHTRLVPGFVVDTKLDGNARIVTFGNGMVAREEIVTLDDSRHRLAYANVGGRLTHHNATAEVFAEGENRCRFVWTADLLPNELAGLVDGMMEQGAAILKRTMEQQVAASRSAAA